LTYEPPLRFLNSTSIFVEGRCQLMNIFIEQVVQVTFNRLLNLW